MYTDISVRIGLVAKKLPRNCQHRQFHAYAVHHLDAGDASDRRRRRRQVVADQGLEGRVDGGFGVNVVVVIIVDRSSASKGDTDRSVKQDVGE